MTGIEVELDNRSKPEALFSIAWDYYDTRHSPETAADDIAALD